MPVPRTSKTQREFALDVVKRLREAGHEALLAGGCVRDELLGREPKDFDVATSALPAEVRELFGHRRTLAIGAAFGVISVRGGGRGNAVEVATFRTDGTYRDGRRPVSVEFTDAEHDAQRRDFTINGLFYDPVAEQVVDYVGGVADLHAGVVRAIGDPRRRFGEDKLRLLRAVRFAATLAFELEGETLAAIREMAGDAASVSGERIGAELRRILTHEHRRRGAELLADAGLLEPLLPEACTQHQAAWNAALVRLERLEAPTLPAALAALAADGIDRAAVAAMGRRLRLPNKEIAHTQWLAEHLPAMLAAAELPWPRLQRLLAHEGGEELLGLAAASLPADDAGLARCRAQRARPADQWNPPPLVTGDDLVAHGLRAGKHFAELLDHLRDEQLEGRLRSREEALDAARRWVAAR